MWRCNSICVEFVGATLTVQVEATDEDVFERILERLASNEAVVHAALCNGACGPAARGGAVARAATWRAASVFRPARRPGGPPDDGGRAAAAPRRGPYAGARTGAAGGRLAPPPLVGRPPPPVARGLSTAAAVAPAAGAAAGTPAPRAAAPTLAGGAAAGSAGPHAPRPVPATVAWLRPPPIPRP